jgi:hypothetical protein
MYELLEASYRVRGSVVILLVGDDGAGHDQLQQRREVLVRRIRSRHSLRLHTHSPPFYLVGGVYV